MPEDFLVLLVGETVLAKKTSKNQITLPKAVVANFRGVDYFEISTDGHSIVLRPLQASRAAEVRERLERLGMGEEEVAAALQWARKRSDSTRRFRHQHNRFRSAVRAR